MLSKALTRNDFIEDESGVWVATILATTHNLGVGVTLCKMQKLGSDGNYHNTIQSFTVEANGDIKVYVDEPGAYRVTILDTTTRDI